MEFRAISPEELTLNPFQAIGKDWMLVTAQNGETANPMTASWGGVGVLWNKPVAYTFLRPQRFTRELVDAAESWSLAFLDETYRAQLGLCGAKSGRELDKVAACGFEIRRDGETPYIAQAHTVLLCRKLFRQHLDPACFIAGELDGQYYPNKDYHFLYVGEIVKVLVKE